jgi:hypothetical protein
MKTNTATKSLRGKKGTVGAPAKTIKFPRGAFTIAAVVAINPHVCELTVRNKIEAGVASKDLVRLSENLETKKVGRPSFRYMTKTAATAAKANRKSVKAPRKATIPAAVLAPAPVETPAIAEISHEIPATLGTPAEVEAVG